MSDEIQRYDPELMQDIRSDWVAHYAGMEPYDAGDYVRYGDHLAALAANDAQIERLEDRIKALETSFARLRRI